ncbi:hypothetical protein ACQCX2_14445 [Propionibacteriaceae bacterium Y1700]|uniref:hypothetical protein n=1 Tax=Microlunatus sp. Y1700 TaxID=3418487 RepID=UPI003DA71EAE
MQSPQSPSEAETPDSPQVNPWTALDPDSDFEDTAWGDDPSLLADGRPEAPSGAGEQIPTDEQIPTEHDQVPAEHEQVPAEHEQAAHVDAPSHETTDEADPDTEEFRPQHAPDFDQPVYTENQLRPAGVAFQESPSEVVEPVAETPLPRPVRIIGGVLAGLVAAQGVARFGELVLAAVGALTGNVPPLVGVLGVLLFVLPVAACAWLASRRSRYSLIVGGVLALVVAVLGRIGGVDLTAVLSG